VVRISGKGLVEIFGTRTQLSDRKKGLIGIWVGNTSGGDFANFKIVPA
jgi:hypothetical protein